MRGLHDSGAYQDIDVYPGKHYTSFGEQCRRAYEYYNHPEINQKCSEAYPDELWKCLCGEYMLPLVETPSQVQFFQYDSYQLSNELGTIICLPKVSSKLREYEILKISIQST